jgi:DNA (cytosine-5)-methyltransferase 1
VVNSFNVLSLFSGIGGLDLAFKRVFPESNVVGYIERDSYAISVLVARMAEKKLDPAPVYTGDFRDLSPAELPRIHAIIGGYPCQPFSAAGTRRSENDERYLWPFIADLIRRSRPSVCFFENVAGHISLGFSRVLADLAALGFDAEWDCVTAREVGTPQVRRRLFVLAWDLRDADGNIFYRQRAKKPPKVVCKDLGCNSKNNPSFPPEPQELEKWREYVRQGGPEPSVYRSPDGVPRRLDARLRCLGNAVVPQQGELALRRLLSRIKI